MFELSKQILGEAILVSVLPEIPLFYYAQSFISKFSYAGCIRLSQLAYVIRLVGYMAIDENTSGLFIISLQLLHGPSFVLLYNSYIEIIYKLAPENFKATANSLFSVLQLVCGIIAHTLWTSLYVSHGWVFLCTCGICVNIGLIIYSFIDLNIFTIKTNKINETEMKSFVSV